MATPTPPPAADAAAPTPRPQRRRSPLTASSSGPTVASSTGSAAFLTEPDVTARILDHLGLPVAALATTGACDGGEESLGCVLGHLLVAVGGAIAVSAVDILVVAESSEEPASMVLPLLVGNF